MHGFYWSVPTKSKQAGIAVVRGGQNCQLANSEIGGIQPAVRSRGGGLPPNARNVDHVD